MGRHQSSHSNRTASAPTVGPMDTHTLPRTSAPAAGLPAPGATAATSEPAGSSGLRACGASAGTGGRPHLGPSGPARSAPRHRAALRLQPDLERLGQRPLGRRPGGSQSWEAFFGSSDAGNSITVDKPPAALWVMALSVRGSWLSSAPILLPEVLMGVATVGALYATVRRHFGAGAGLLAGVVVALTSVAVLMFRFNNPDALLTPWRRSGRGPR